MKRVSFLCKVLLRVDLEMETYCISIFSIFQIYSSSQPQFQFQGLVTHGQQQPKNIKWKFSEISDL